MEFTNDEITVMVPLVNYGLGTKGTLDNLHTPPFHVNNHQSSKKSIEGVIFKHKQMRAFFFLNRETTIAIMSHQLHNHYVIM